jgi:hypothetical protein
MGMVSSGALASMVLADKNMMWNVPKHWTLEDAATVCCVYGTVSCHEVKSKLENVLFISWDLTHICKIWSFHSDVSMDGGLLGWCTDIGTQPDCYMAQQPRRP